MAEYQLIHAVAFRSEDCWIAQCLEYDICSQAPTLYELLTEVERELEAHVIIARAEGIEPFAGVPKAPRRFWEMYKNGRPLPDAMPAQRSSSVEVEELPRVELALAA